MEIHSKEIVSFVQKKRKDGSSLRKLAVDLKISKSIVEYMLKNE